MSEDNVLVTLNNYDIPNVRSVKSFSNIDWGKVSCLIFHSSSDSDLDVVKELTTLLVEKVIYINRNINPLHYCIFTGLNADIYDTEEYLLDPETINFLITSYGNTGLTMTQPSEDLAILAKSIAAISVSSVENLQRLTSNTFWTKTLNTAISNVEKGVNLASKVNIDVVEMFTESSKLIKELEEVNDRTLVELDKLQNIVNDADRRSKPNTPFMFATYTVPITVQKVLYVKGYGECRYLKSFIYSYHNYLKMSKQSNTKLLFILPKLQLYTQKYKDEATRLSQDSVDIVDFNSTSTFMTYEPKKLVMDAFFSQQGVKVFIVVDLLYGDDLLAGHMITKLYSVSGITDIKKFNLNENLCILPITGKKTSIIIPRISEFSNSNESTKRYLYVEKCKDQFESMNKLINI